MLRVDLGLWRATLLVLIVLATPGCGYDFSLGSLHTRDAGIDVAMSIDTTDVSADTPVMPDRTIDVPDVGDVEASPCATCSAAETCCADACVNTDRDPAHCGDCTTVCLGTTCADGSCTGTCRMGFVDCDGNVANGCEVDAATDLMNCGACGHGCSVGHNCQGGVCTCALGTADCDGNPTNGCEADIQLDPHHCGGCMTGCAAGQGCMAGACVCAAGLLDCDRDPANGCETDGATDAANCGACGHPCGTNSSCVGGACTCSAGYQRCPADAPGGCTVSITDAMHCGACGTACAAPVPVCGATGCTDVCAAGETPCGSSCATTGTDVGNCGACGNACVARAHSATLCASGVCTFACASGFADCNGTAADGCEVNTVTDAANCGGCGNACSSAQSCVAGLCACPSGQRDCGGGRCAACCDDADCSDGNPCATRACTGTPAACQLVGTCTGTTSTCCAGVGCRACCVDADCATMSGNHGCNPADGTCTLCAAGFRDCDGAASNGCEASVATDTANCGSCGDTCAFANASSACRAGACHLGACNAGFADCDGDPMNGCESNLATSAANCGVCGHPCTAMDNICVGGACVLNACPASRGDCDHDPTNGCEADLLSNVADCGACGNVCSYPHAAATCTGGVCGLGGCAPGYLNCDGVASNGCETSTTGDVNNCGACAHACAFANAVPSCTAGVCAIGSCQGGFADCDGNAANGCETSTNTSLASCGGCGRTCTLPSNAASASCTAGTCGFTCLPNFEDCDGNPANGCEASTAASAATCGLCTTACAGAASASAACLGGSCGIVCAAGTASCDGDPSNGCEANLASSVTSCGSCGLVCHGAPNASAACIAGVCDLACNPGFANCNGSALDGCEIETAFDPAHCGSCGRACTGSQQCSAGACVAVCPAGERTCSRACVADSSTDRVACGAACVACNDNEACIGGSCQRVTCAGGSRACAGVCTNTNTDPQNCGACGARCGLAQVCIAHACTDLGADCSAPIPIALGSGPATVTGTTVGRTNTAGSCPGSGPDVWYSFTLTQTELVYIDTFGSSINTEVGFVTGACGLMPTCTDDSCSVTQTQTSAVFAPGTYRLVLDTNGSATGAYQLHVQHLAVNGAMSGTLPTGTFSQAGTTVGAANSAASCGPGPDRWYAWSTCPSAPSGTFTATTCGMAAFDTVLQLRNGDGTGACNNDACGQQSRVTAAVAAGAGIHVLYVDGVSAGAAGPYTVTGSRP